MPKLRVLSVTAVLKILHSYGFAVESQRGSHLKLTRVVDGERQVLVVPNHKEIDKGTLAAIIRQTSRYVEEADLLRDFYTS